MYLCVIMEQLVYNRHTHITQQRHSQVQKQLKPQIMDSVKVWPLTNTTYNSSNKPHSQNNSRVELCLQAGKWLLALLRTVVAMGLTPVTRLVLLLPGAQIEKPSDLKQSDFVCICPCVCLCGGKRRRTAMCYIVNVGP